MTGTIIALSITIVAVYFIGKEAGKEEEKRKRR